MLVQAPRPNISCILTYCLVASDQPESPNLTRPGYPVFFIHGPDRFPNSGGIPGDPEGMNGHPYDSRQGSDLEYFVRTDMERGKGDENYGSREPFSQA